MLRIFLKMKRNWLKYVLESDTQGTRPIKIEIPLAGLNVNDIDLADPKITSRLGLGTEMSIVAIICNQVK